MKVRFYGKLAGFFGSEREIATGTPCTVAELRERLAMEYPEGAESLQHKRVSACIGDDLAEDHAVIPEGAVLEFLAPVSGG